MALSDGTITYHLHHETVLVLNMSESLSGGHLSSPHSIRVRGVERRSGHNGRYDLLRQQIEGLYVSDAAQEILETYVDQRLYPLDGLASC